jgi:ribosomal protein S18 acetylase RimI-like enzyme
MVLADIPGVHAVALSAGERFREFDDQRIARCADDEPISVGVLRQAVEAGSAFVVHDETGAVAGFLVAEVLDGSAHVEEVAVSVEAGGRGYASALLDEVSRWAAAQGLPTVTLTTFRDVSFNRPFYERRGFRVLSDHEISPALAARVEEEDAAGLPADLRVAMRRDVRSP